MNKKVSTTIFSGIMVTALAISVNVSGLSFAYLGGFEDDRAHVNYKFGDEVKDMKNQTQFFGLDVDYKLDVLPFNVAVGYFASSSEKGIVTLSLSELRLGARKYQDFDSLSIYYGGGLSNVSAKLEADGFNLPGNTDSTLGFYGEVGGLYRVTKAIHFGTNVTYTRATVELYSTKEKMDMSGAQIGLFVGYAFRTTGLVCRGFQFGMK